MSPLLRSQSLSAFDFVRPDDSISTDAKHPRFEHRWLWPRWSLAGLHDARSRLRGCEASPGSEPPCIPFASPCVCRNTTFLSKVLPESLIEAHAQIVWSSSRTMVAKIDLFTEVLETGERTLATTTNASYVAVGEEEGAGSIGKTSAKLPDFGHENERLASEGELFYRSRKAFIKNASEGLLPRLDKIAWTLELAHVVQRTDCWYETDMAKGGMLIDLMDEAAGKVAFTYTGRVCATVSIDNLSIVKPLYLGDLASIKARPAFVSGKMMEIEVVAFGSQRFSNKSQLAAYGHFVFVCLGDDGRAVTLPKLMDTADVAAQERARMRQQRREATKLVSSM